MIERFMRGVDAAFCQITLTTCFLIRQSDHMYSILLQY